MSELEDPSGQKIIHNIPGTSFDADMPSLERSMRDRLKQPPLMLNCEQGKVLLAQFQETAAYRAWEMISAAVMANHVHIVVGVPGDPNPEHILRDFKSYGSRALNRQWGKPASGTWWTESGSKRKLPNERAAYCGAAYVRDQEFPLVVWLDPKFANEIGERGNGERDA